MLAPQAGFFEGTTLGRLAGEYLLPYPELRTLFFALELRLPPLLTLLLAVFAPARVVRVVMRVRGGICGIYETQGV